MTLREKLKGLRIQSRRQYYIVGLVIGLLLGAVFATIIPLLRAPPISVVAQQSRAFTLNIQGADIQVSNNTVWHAWTFNGTVPGPTLHVTVGQTLVVTVFNHLNLMHSFHTHLSPYNFSDDGSQANIISGIGTGSMIKPGQSYTYVLQADQAGIFYYHCHSSEQHPISYHIHQGLYGAIVVDQPDAPRFDHDWTIFMGEAGMEFTGSNYPPYIMNGMGIPGGEAALMNIFNAQGITGVVNQFNKTLPAFVAKVGQSVRFNIINIGDQVHSFHMHGVNLISEWYFPGHPWPANVVQLVPGSADSVMVSPQEPGLWLFHCHVVAHADAGMIGIFDVTT